MRCVARGCGDVAYMKQGKDHPSHNTITCHGVQKQVDDNASPTDKHFYSSSQQDKHRHDRNFMIVDTLEEKKARPQSRPTSHCVFMPPHLCFESPTPSKSNKGNRKCEGGGRRERRMTV